MTYVKRETALPGLNILTEGPGGTGKTTAIHTAVDLKKDDGSPRYEVFYLGLEPGMESLIGWYTERKLPIPDNLHWRYIPMGAGDLESMIDAAEKINSWNLEMLAKQQDPNKGKYNMAINFLKALNGFEDERTGENFGRVLDWGTDRILAMDGLTGLSRASMSMVVGGKPVRSQSDWGIAMDQVEKYLLYLTDSCRCHFLLNAHVEREPDQVLGGVKITTGTLGQKLAPKIPPMFSDVILCVRDGSTWVWDTANTQADLKTRNLPISSKIPQDFKTIFDKWEARNAAAEVVATNKDMRPGS